MADIVVTAANVRPLNGALIRRGVAGAVLAPGQFVYLDGANGWKLADGSAAASSRTRGVVIGGSNGAVSLAIGSVVDVVEFGPVEGFTALTPGGAGFVSDTAGAIDQAAAGTNSYIAGWAESATIFFVAPGLTQSEALFDGDNVALTASGNVVGGLPVLHHVLVVAGANGDTDIIVTHKTRVVEVIAHPRTSVANATLQVKNGANALSDAMVAAVAGVSTHAASLAVAQDTIAAGGTLRVTGAGGATQPDADVYVLGIPVA